MSEILPCPFCGEKDITFITTQGDKWGNAECEHCGGTGPEVRTLYDPKCAWHEEAIKAWNARPLRGGDANRQEPSPSQDAIMGAASELQDWLLFRMDRDLGIPDVAEIADALRKHLGPVKHD